MKITTILVYCKRTDKLIDVGYGGTAVSQRLRKRYGRSVDIVFTTA